MTVNVLLMQKELASVAESVAHRLHASEESRSLLIEQTREFKKNSAEVKTLIFLMHACVTINPVNVCRCMFLISPCLHWPRQFCVQL